MLAGMALQPAFMILRFAQDDVGVPQGDGVLRMPLFELVDVAVSGT